MRPHAGLNQRYTGLPISFPLLGQFILLGRDRNVLREGSCRNSSQHEVPSEEAYEMVLLGN